MPQPVKLIVASDSGMGKTGALASLAAAGYSLRIADMDNNSGILKGLLLSDPNSPYLKANKDVGKMLTSVVAISEERGLIGVPPNAKMGIKKATAWLRLSSLLENWDDGMQKLGPITSWTTQDVLVIDTFTKASRAAMNFHLSLNGRLNQKPTLYDFGDAQELLRTLLDIICAPEVGCNVVLNCHIDRGETKSGVPTEFPMSIGNALGPQIATYFGSLLQLVNQAKGIGAARIYERKFITVPASPLGVKTSAPFSAQAEYPLQTGLADYFKAVRGE